MYDAKKRFM
jgi:hypothetical protein